MAKDATVHDPQPNLRATDLAGATERLRQAVSKAGGPTRISERSEVSLSTLNNYLSGGEIKLSNLLRLARACGVSVEWIATGHGPLPQWLRKDAVVMGLSAEPQAPLAAGAIDTRWLAKAIEIVEALGGAKLPIAEKARRIAHSYELLTAPEADIPPLPPVAPRGR